MLVQIIVWKVCLSINVIPTQKKPQRVHDNCETAPLEFIIPNPDSAYDAKSIADVLFDSLKYLPATEEEGLVTAGAQIVGLEEDDLTFISERHNAKNNRKILVRFHFIDLQTCTYDLDRVAL